MHAAKLIADRGCRVLFLAPTGALVNSYVDRAPDDGTAANAVRYRGVAGDGFLGQLATMLPPHADPEAFSGGVGGSFMLPWTTRRPRGAPALQRCGADVSEDNSFLRDYHGLRSAIIQTRTKTQARRQGTKRGKNSGQRVRARPWGRKRGGPEVLDAATALRSERCDRRQSQPTVFDVCSRQL